MNDKEMTNTEQFNMEAYCEAIIKTALHNGLTPEQIIANPDACRDAYFQSQMRELDKMEAELKEMFKNK